NHNGLVHRFPHCMVLKVHKSSNIFPRSNVLAIHTWSRPHKNKDRANGVFTGMVGVHLGETGIKEP
ncbi:MAG: hypothetical protein ACE5GH_02920, partial [Fidelibacterota bacterium]